MREPSDTELVRRFQQGDGHAFATFTERHRDRLYRLAYTWVGDAMLAQDIVQETFARSYTGLGKFRFRAAPTTWLIRVCRNISLEMLRQHKSGEPDSEMLLQSMAAKTTPSTELPEYLRIAVFQLPDRQRDVLILRLLEEVSVRDTALVLGCREGTVKAHLARAVRNLRTYLTDAGIEMSDFTETLDG